MRLDLEDFRQHYASLSDEALLALDRAELVEDAQKCYDEEIARRQLHIQSNPNIAERLPGQPLEHKKASSNIDTGMKPDWLESAACACTFTARPGYDDQNQLEDARNVLEAAGIQGYVIVHEPERESVNPPRLPEYELAVPGGFAMLAQSELDKEIFNPPLEQEWRTHFELLSDEQLQELSLEALTRVYNEEVTRRKQARV